MALEILSQSERADGTFDVRFILDGNEELWVGVKLELMKDFDVYVYQTKASQAAQVDEMGVV